MDNDIEWTDLGVAWGQDCPDGMDGRHSAYRSRSGAWCECGAHLSVADLERTRPWWAVGRQLDAARTVGY